MLARQLSETVGGVQVTFAPHVPAVASAFTLTVDGQPVITGLVTSFTITLNVHVDCLPEASVAVYVTAVVPMEKNCAGSLVLVIVTAQLSVAVGGVHVTFAPQTPRVASAFTVIVEGQPVITGFVTSFTITLNEQVDCRPEASVAVYVTTVVPTEKNCPGALLLVMLTTQLSVTAGGVHVTVVPHVPAEELALTVIVDGHPVMMGLVASFTTTLNVQVDCLPLTSVAV